MPIQKSSSAMIVRMTWPMYRRRQVSVGHVVIQLSPLQRELVSTLLVRRGQFIHLNQIIEAVYDDGEPDWAANCLRVQIGKLRAKGVPIMMRPCIGYMIPGA